MKPRQQLLGVTYRISGSLTFSFHSRDAAGHPRVGGRIVPRLRRVGGRQVEKIVRVFQCLEVGGVFSKTRLHAREGFLQVRRIWSNIV